ncbi:transposase family protein [Streptomyces tubercidicus]|uniref:Transposase IS204/IS1001/IS1096/IS1165 zinc-finger domain-containing protein n=1 Tax=Streptomyces tubercidicus TaxID=47759 RepID=A0A640ULU3_9ACTN|nr:hypothetical protein Stube_09450 [Streptomyces tubercidicus]
MLRLEELLFPSIADVLVLSVDVNNEAIRIEACSTATGSACPACGTWSSRVHSSYLRFPADVPSAGQRVVLCLRVRRFACAISSCGRRTFVEQVLGLTREARGFKVWSRTDFQRGDYVQRRGGRWFAVLRVNSKSVTVPHIQNGIGQKVVHAEGSRLDWTYTVPYDEVTGRMSAEEMTQHLQDSRRVTPCPPPAVCAGGRARPDHQNRHHHDHRHPGTIPNATTTGGHHRHDGHRQDSRRRLRRPGEPPRAATGCGRSR